MDVSRLNQGQMVAGVGGVVLLIFACLDSEPDNQYGPSPKPHLGYPGPAAWG